jgi:hypothetical protein
VDGWGSQPPVRALEMYPHIIYTHIHIHIHEPHHSNLLPQPRTTQRTFTSVSACAFSKSAAEGLALAPTPPATAACCPPLPVVAAAANASLTAAGVLTWLTTPALSRPTPPAYEVVVVVMMVGRGEM